MAMSGKPMNGMMVAPFAGAWIEISSYPLSMKSSVVAPFAGAWIEMRIATASMQCGLSRSLRGSVD